MRTTSGRGHKSYKGYICVFICLSTKAVHLEAVSNLTAQGFIQCFRRFIFRRGRCVKLWSDNGTNFGGASVELSRMFKESSRFYKDAAISVAEDGTTWSFIPPSAPHFGGLWEAGVKSVKHHLRRVIGAHTLPFYYVK